RRYRTSKSVILRRFIAATDTALRGLVAVPPRQPALVVHPARHDRIDPSGELHEGEIRSAVKPPTAHFAADLLLGVLADRRQERREVSAVPVLRLTRAKRESQEGERRVFVRAASVSISAIHDFGLVGVQSQPDLFHPVLERGQHLLGLPLGDAVHDRVIRVPFELDGRELPRQPGIERVVHEQVREHGRYHAPNAMGNPGMSHPP
ncbi:MAG: hypothetical protein QOI83_956, partial [Streptomycetaceae bacterium]|nr:hypothetical protein [Streptomycetaceae bacterium]